MKKKSNKAFCCQFAGKNIKSKRKVFGDKNFFFASACALITLRKEKTIELPLFYDKHVKKIKKVFFSDNILCIRAHP